MTVHINLCYNMSGNRISVKTLDLNLPFEEISQQLNSIVVNEFTSYPLCLIRRPQNVFLRGQVFKFSLFYCYERTASCFSKSSKE